MSESSKGTSRLVWTLASALITLALLLLGFTICSSLAAAVKENPWWMLSAGLFCSLALPVIVASWIRRLRSRKREARHPTTLGAIAGINLAMVLGGLLIAPSTTAFQLRRHGAWWVESIVALTGQRGDSPVTGAAHRGVEWLAGLVEEPAEPDHGRSRPSDGGPEDARAGAEARVPSPDAAPSSRPAAGEVRVAYEKRGSSVIVPVVLHGPRTHLKVKMLLDTGASLTTLDRPTLRRLGIRPPHDAPTIEMHTANGAAKRTISVIEGVTLGVAKITGGITFAVCDPCAREQVVGLLGMNVLRHFKVTLDDDAGVIVLNPRTKSGGGDLLDVRPFVKLSDATGTWRGPMLTVRAVLHNRSPRKLIYVKLVAEVREGERVGRIWGELRDVPAHGTSKVTLQGLSAVKGGRFVLKLESADW